MELFKRSLDYSPDNLETEIASLEAAMGIETPADRFLEACLFIDRHFVIGGLLTDSPLPTDRMFGDQEWASYLQARLLTRNADEFEDFGLLLERLHLRIMGEAAQEMGGELRGFDGGLGGQFVNDEFLPITVTQRDIQNMRQLGRVTFLSTNDPENPYQGYVKYPNMPTRAILDRLYWAHGVYCEGSQDPYWEATNVQQEIIIAHPYDEVSGRISRLAMNWRLELRGYAPSMLDDFDADVFSTPEQQLERVKAGSQLHEAVQRLIKSGVTEPLDLLGLRPLKRFHDELYVPSAGITRPEYVAGAIHPHIVTKRYLADVQSQARRYGLEHPLLQFLTD